MSSPNPIWTIDRVDSLKALFRSMTPIDLAEALSQLPGHRVTAPMVIGKAAVLGLRRVPEPVKASGHPNGQVKLTREDRCRNGHSLSDAYATATGGLECRTCNNERMAASRKQEPAPKEWPRWFWEFKPFMGNVDRRPDWMRPIELVE